jgi:hypothetical protein
MGRWNNKGSVFPNQRQDRKPAQCIVFFAWLRLTSEKPDRFSITCLGYFSAVGGKIFNIAAGFFDGVRLPIRTGLDTAGTFSWILPR